MNIPFNRPYMTGNELHNIAEAHFNGRLAGDGPFTERCHAWLEEKIGCAKALLTHSCTAALEMAALLIDVKPGDEIIMPSYTFVSTANAFVLRGGVPVFVDICPDTFNIDASKIEGAITPRTRAIVPVHYAGVGCDMFNILRIADKYNLHVIEDAAQGLMSSYQNRPLGSFGQLAAVSFHETKNIIAGEGGALLINDKSLAARAEILREKGTNRSKFFRGEVDKYTWVDIGSSYLPGELTAAFLYAQMEKAESITRTRLKIWDMYNVGFLGLVGSGHIRRPIIPADCCQNAHMYYLLVETREVRTALISYLKNAGIDSVFHYVPLHSSPAGRRYGRCSGSLSVTDNISERILRLPLWPGFDGVAQVVEQVEKFFATA